MRVNHYMGVTDAQKELIAVWSRLAEARCGLPSKQDLDPGLLRRHLSRISLLDLKAGDAPRFRLSGSRLSAMIGMDPTGLSPADLPAPHGDIFSLGLEPILVNRLPVGGVVSLTQDGSSQAWLRLPLADGAGELRYVLCHDDVLVETDGQEDELVHGAIHVEKQSIAA
ncbi:MAG: PAS domain-containing protein [Hyphomonadaceae bacterium]|nr:PAS domain-containing protein [Hyphomonadaceae bacterium]